MIQRSRPAPSAPACRSGHMPQLVETRGAPAGHPIGTPCPPTWHVECAICQIATVPATAPELALSRWVGRLDLFHTPLSQLSAARGRVLACAR